MASYNGRTNALGKQRRRIELALAQEDYEPYIENIRVAKKLRMVLAKRWEAGDESGVLEVARELVDANDCLCKYLYPRIKSVEMTTDAELVEKMPLEAQIAMAREFAQLIGYDFIKRHTNGGGNIDGNGSGNWKTERM